MNRVNPARRGSVRRRARCHRVRIEHLEDRAVPALVAAYAFDEGTGTTTADASGTGNGGTLSGPTWAAGRFGQALSFDGVNDLVTVNDAASLDLTTAMTIEAWVRPAATAVDWTTVVMKERPGGLAYTLYAADGANRPPAGYVFASGNDRAVIGTGALPLNGWTHLATTYDGVIQRLFVNGVEVASRAQTGGIATSTNPLRVGGNTVWGEYFNGLIDEVRVYSHPLTAAQIAVDMNAPIGNADVTPPTVTSVTPLMGTTGVAANTTFTATFSEALNPATVTAATVELRNPAGAVVPAAVSYNAATRTVTLDPNADLPIGAGYFVATLRGGPTGLKDAANNPLVSDFTWAVSTTALQLQDATVFTGLVNPTVVEFASDGRVFVAEKSGRIFVFDSLTDPTPDLFANLHVNVHNFWDRGLLGMTLHPNFPATPYIYVLYAYDGDVPGTSPGGVPAVAAPKYGNGSNLSDPGPDPTGRGAWVSGRLSRLQATGNFMTGPETVLIHDWPQQFPSHSIGTVGFGSDGALYVSGGDGASFNYVDYGQPVAPNNPGNPFGDPASEGGSVRSQDLLSPGDPTTLDGAILRVDPNTGAALPDNPLFVTGNDANARRVIAHGARNPFRFTFRPGTSELWLGDVGWGTYEEINRVASPTDAVVENFGWPAYEGPNRQGGYDGANLPLLESLYAAGPAAHAAPHFAYQHGVAVVPGSGEATGSGSSISGLAFAPSSAPAGFQGALIFSDYSRDTIWVMYRGVNGLPDPANRALFFRSTANEPDVVNLRFGPDGHLYFPDFNSGSIRRLSFVGPKQPPNAVVTSSARQGAAPLTVNFNGSGSNDPNPGDTLTFAWDLDGDGQFDDAITPTASWTYTTPGTYAAALRVTDPQGASDVEPATVTVGTPPTPVINSPGASLTWRVGDTIAFSGTANDPEQIPFPASGLSWSLILHHAGHTHPIQDFVGVAGGSFVAPDHGYPAHLELRLTATDATGLTGTTSVQILPQTTTLTLQSSPAGLQVALNGSAGAGSVAGTVMVGSANTVSAPSPQVLGGTTYVFSNWSDGGAATHTVTAGSAATTLTATFAPAPAPTGLVAAYGFEELTGPTTADLSGNNLTGTLSGATRTASGRHGRALSFDGVNDLVTVNDNNVLDLTTGMTVEAWVRPAAAAADWTTVVMKERTGGLAYTLYAADGAGRPPAGYINRNGNDVPVAGSSTLTLNTWTHVAVTYDGANLRLFVNGAQVASQAQTGPITTSTNPLRIGGNTIWGEYFNGLIDEVRIYNRALSAAEITTDMSTPVGGGGGAQLADRPAASPARTSVELTDEQVASALAAALDLWRAAGLPTRLVPRAATVRVVVADLPGNGLGFTDMASGKIWLDRDAAGYGWVPVVGGFDLDTVLAHEVGHLLGIDDLPADPTRPVDLMDQSIAPGEVRRPSDLDVRLSVGAADELKAPAPVNRVASSGETGEAVVAGAIDLTGLDLFVGAPVPAARIEPSADATEPGLIVTTRAAQLDATALDPLSVLVAWSDEWPKKEWWTPEPLDLDPGVRE